MSKLCKSIIVSITSRHILSQHVIRRLLITNISRIPCYQCAVPMSADSLCNKQFARLKSTKKKTYDSDDESNSFNDDDLSLSKDSKLVKFNTTSMRADLILKSSLGVARNKIEQYFYESKIRINGRKILKKSASVREGDEMDIIKSASPKNPNHLHVARAEILDIEAQEENIRVTVRRFKNLLIENYKEDPYKGSSKSED